MPRTTNINITIHVNDDGTTSSVEMDSNCSTRDRVLAAMYLLEDAMRSEEPTEENPNPIAGMCAAGFNAAMCMYRAVKELEDGKDNQ